MRRVGAYAEDELQDPFPVDLVPGQRGEGGNAAQFPGGAGV